jgi:hypothetical protein
METLSSFPLLDDDRVLKLSPSFSPYRFYFKDDEGVEVDLTAEDVSSSVHPLSDEHGRWSPDKHGFGFERAYTINNAPSLYGKDGIACADAVLALVLVWKSPDSRQRSAFEIGEVINRPGEQEFPYRHYYNKPIFKGRLDLQVCLVIKEAGIPAEGEELFANMAGTVLGVLDSYSVRFDGFGSSFPVMVVNDVGGLLWSVRCDFDDPLTDKLVDTVAINLNSAHRDFKYINHADRKNFNPSFLRQVLADALSTIVDYIRETPSWWDEIVNGKGEPESVAMAMNYFLTTLELNLDDPKQCSIAFRDLFEHKLLEL